MQTIWYFQGKKVTKKALIEHFGKERVEAMLKDAKETFRYDPYIDLI